MSRRSTWGGSSRAGRAGAGQRPAGTVLVVDPQNATQVGLDANEGPVEEFAPERPDPAFRDRVCAWHLDARQHSGIPGALKNRIHDGRVLGVTDADQQPYCGELAGVLEIHQEVPRWLGDPGMGRMGDGAEDPDPAAGVVDDGEDVLTLPGGDHSWG
ncbi:hypothetical protein [Streptacidiphilus pinicola]|uniref:hypothetical protein n=1 Tax=Streptacidiphilus pinicola TaxID=2219663 RepID=UPI001403BD8D|nr:hypothetical protein [Streptacidiphilus pinicola]